MRTKGEVAIGFVLLVVLALAGIACEGGPDGEVGDAEQYCRMVWVHHRDPAYGWPDYRHIYRQQCHGDGTLNRGYIYGRQ